MSTDISTVASIIDRNSRVFDKSTEGIPADKWLARPSENSNHLLWVAGHVVVHRAKMHKLLGSEWTAPWEKLFLRGSTLASSEAYPAAEEILRAWREVSEKLSAALAGASVEALSKPSAPPTPSFDGTLGGTIAFLTFHETYHVGQMSYLRKWLGYGQTVG
jgi:uncharacterized damage-inducible protein DinB